MCFQEPLSLAELSLLVLGQAVGSASFQAEGPEAVMGLSVKYKVSFGLCLHSPSTWNSLILLKNIQLPEVLVFYYQGAPWSCPTQLYRGNTCKVLTPPRQEQVNPIRPCCWHRGHDRPDLWKWLKPELPTSNLQSQGLGICCIWQFGSGMAPRGSGKGSRNLSQFVFWALG